MIDFIAEADATIDSEIGGRYKVPVPLVDGKGPHPLDYWSRNIAAYLATLTFRGSADFADTDPIVRRDPPTMEALHGVRDGKNALSLEGLDTGSNSGSVGLAVNQYEGTLFDSTDFDLAPDRTVQGGIWINGVWQPWAPLYSAFRRCAITSARGMSPAGAKSIKSMPAWIEFNDGFHHPDGGKAHYLRDSMFLLETENMERLAEALLRDEGKGSLSRHDGQHGARVRRGIRAGSVGVR